MVDPEVLDPVVTDVVGPAPVDCDDGPFVTVIPPEDCMMPPAPPEVFVSFPPVPLSSVAPSAHAARKIAIGTDANQGDCDEGIPFDDTAATLEMGTPASGERRSRWHRTRWEKCEVRG